MGANLTQDPYKPPKAVVDVEVSAPRERDLLKAYVCFAISSLVVGFVAGAVIGARVICHGNGVLGLDRTTRQLLRVPIFRHSLHRDQVCAVA